MRKLSISILLGLFLSLITSSQSFAKSYSITQDVYNITLNSDKSASVFEELTYNFDGSFSWAEFEIPTISGSGKYSYNVPIRNFTIAASDGSVVSILEEQLRSDSYYVKWGYSAIDESKTFLISYTIDDVIQKYTDVAEFYRKIIGPDWTVSHNNIDITVNLPAAIGSKDDIYVYGHGPLSGDSRIVDTQTVRFNADSVAAGQFMEIRVGFPTSLVSGTKDGNLTKTQIQEEEANYVQETIKAAEAAQRSALIFGIVVAIVMLGGLPLWLILWYITWKKSGKEYDIPESPKYVQDIPSNLNPAEVSVLLSQGKDPDIKSFTATLIDLARKGWIKIIDEVEQKTGLLGTKQIIHTTFELSKKETAQPIKDYEQMLLDYLVEIAHSPAGLLDQIFKSKNAQENRSDNKITMDEIKAYFKAHPQEFQEWFKDWQQKVKDQADTKSFLDPESEKASRRFWLISIPFMLNPIIIFLAIILNPKIKRWSMDKIHEVKMWEGLKHFLDDFAKFKELPPQSYILWDRYLIFGILFGNAEKIIKMLPIILANPNATIIPWYIATGANMGIGNIATSAESFTSIANSLNTLTSELMTASTSAAHYSSGGGGGFSGGGGGGSGGGGGGAG